MTELAEVIARVRQLADAYKDWCEGAAVVRGDDLRAICGAAARVAQLEGELAAARAELAAWRSRECKSCMGTGSVPCGSDGADGFERCTVCMPEPQP